ncbi:putative type IX secretion system sortase PorU2 [Ferruginibacter albus]|uniref:putative type IX secretion system sortase PorU2 n=1 Tax=Ferruginibacter albus TaxID=2875540 RepID=UPI001CC4665B|nr:C25 family cysteine peptidase [Ferruginibacter albus]UAY51502.1 hypothetical protein K9M53_13010 [Ferruginibacter albus]
MKKILIPILLLCAVIAKAQLNNSWIDYSKTYYKFYLGKSGLCRINQPALAAAGLSNVPAEQFQLWRNGEQVRIYTSAANGALTGSDYIEFWGKSNDGKPDKTLYLDPNNQMTDSFSLQTDTVAYYLTVNTNGNNLRYSNVINDVANNTLQPDAYFMQTLNHSYKDQLNRGYAVLAVEYLWSSSYDMGEGWTSSDFGTNPCCPLTKQFNGMNVYTGGPANNVSFSVSVFGNAPNNRKFNVKLFNNTIIDTSVSLFATLKIQKDNLPLSYLQSPDYLPAYMSIHNSTDSLNDRIVVGSLSITYPSKFNFNDQTNFYFRLAPSVNGNYLVIDNFNNGGVAPVLYDMNSGSRYTGDISTPGKVKFALPGSLDNIRNFMLVSEAASNLTAINNLKSRKFIDFNIPDNQGDYIIISHPSLYDDGNGVNNVEAYRQYRSSLAGGSFNAKIYSIDELEDQFGLGIRKHPTSIRDFIRFAQSWTVKPKYVLFMGHGISYMDYEQNQSSPAAGKLDLVPSFGWPASDVLLACDPMQIVPLAPTGRIPAINGKEIGTYLNKVQEYEMKQASPDGSISDMSWMKNFVHIAGGADSAETAYFASLLDGYKRIAEDTLLGANVQTFKKSSTAYVEQISGSAIQQLINNGLGFIGYLGHSSANTLAFNLSEPTDYTNQGRYPFFNVSGCSAGNYFGFDSTRLNGNLSISEKWTLANERGCIGFLASTSLGIPTYLNTYNTELYSLFSNDMYGNTIGNQIKEVIQATGGTSQLLGVNGGVYMRLHLEQINLDGDPAIKLSNFTLPDYAIDESLVKISPSIISVADNNFNVSIAIKNLGRAITDSMRVTVKRQLPDGSFKILFDQKIAATKNTDSLNFTVQINPATDKGDNKLMVVLDADSHITESSETNNSVSKDFTIFEDELKPIYPYNYSIVNQSNINYVASTANPLGGQRQYFMELDTTALFNSPFKKSYNNTGVGGVITFGQPAINYTDSTVYYWRTAIQPLSSSTPIIWNPSSFVYLPNSSTGFNQSHYYQELNSTYTDIRLDSVDRLLKFVTTPASLKIKTGLFPYYNWDQINTYLDFTQLEFYGCNYNSIQVEVFDSATLMPWNNYDLGGIGRFGSKPACGQSPVKPYRNFFEFPYADPAYRKNLINFFDSIPDGMYISLTNLGVGNNIYNEPPNASFIDDWKKDTLTLGAGNSLYNKLKNIGFTQIDSFTHNIPFIYFFRKNRSYAPQQFVGRTESDSLEAIFPLSTIVDSGFVQSPVFGPAKKWTSLHWSGRSLDKAVGDTVQIQVYGIDANNNKVLLTSFMPSAIDTLSLSFVNATTYPFVQLNMVNKDNNFLTPNQLNYWRINADYVPEGAVAPNILFNMQDTVVQGAKIPFALAFKNISPVQFDSLKIRFRITDASNNTTDIAIPKGKALLSGDTLVIRDTIDTKLYAGLNTLYVIVNPDNDQPEQYLFNNSIYKNFFVIADKYNPLLDVTFDGVHILNEDIVSSKPHITIKLKDENKFLSLNDTSLLKVQVLYPDPSNPTIPSVPRPPFVFGDTMQFIPADLSKGENTASINLMPSFPVDGTYELIVSGKDVQGNTAGNLEYRVSFTVINKTMISELFNYPNPFTTSTAFVFTLTGSQLPQNMRIQILTITGKVVKEIMQSELGPLHIGNNITEYKWDGTDMYGQKLANGVYLYRVLTNLNGKSIDKYTGTDANKNQVTNGLGDASKYFNSGYGKMYLMR